MLQNWIIYAANIKNNDVMVHIHDKKPAAKNAHNKQKVCFLY